MWTDLNVLKVNMEVVECDVERCAVGKVTDVFCIA
jgi:hypothetical protein